MRTAFLPGYICIGTVVPAAESTLSHADWDDLNKNGKQEVYELTIN
jgi:hypothetical protein